MVIRRSLLVLMIIALFSCRSDDKKAAYLLKRAENSYLLANYNEAKLCIDSIRTLYPKAFGVRKSAIKLMQQVELKEQEISLHYLDSVLAVKMNVLDSLKRFFVFEKDTVYQEMGNYFYPTQTVEKNVGRTFLRASVNENGEMSLTSIYCGSTSLKHNSIKVSLGDNFAQTPISSDIYYSTDLGHKIEKADYKAGNDGGVIGFILSNKDAKSLKLEFVGGHSYRTLMYSPDIKAIVKITDLAQLLSAIYKIKGEKKEVILKTRFLNKKIEENSSFE